jgi:hypothetical protein
MTTKQRILERIDALPDTPETEVLLERFVRKLYELFPEAEVDFLERFPEIDFPPRSDAPS